MNTNGITDITMLVYNIIETFTVFFGSNAFLLSITTISCILKLYIISRLLATRPIASLHIRNRTILLIMLGCAISEDVAWIFKLCRTLFFPSIDYSVLRFVIRISWALAPIRYNALALFLENSLEQSKKVSLWQKIFMFLTAITTCSFLFIAVFYLHCPSVEYCPVAEIVLIRLTSVYTQFILLSMALWYVLSRLRLFKGPRIIAYQMNTLMKTLILPTIVMDILQSFPFNLCITSPTWITNSYISVSLSNILSTYMTYYCARKMVGLRFLNIEDHVQSTKNFNFIDNFKEVLGRLGQATTIQELAFITQEIFQNAFHIPLRAITIHACSYQSRRQNSSQTAASLTIDTVLNASDSQLSKDVRDAKILIYDEIAFNNFYEKDEQSHNMLNFLDSIGADIFIPISNQGKIVGCIVIERGARPNALYGNIERDEMIVFASYLGAIINLLQNRNLEHVIASEKEMKEELFSKHQEINQYKESMRTFLHNKKHSRIGILFYKNRQFIFGNREAQELVNINLNVQIGHSFAKACRKVVSDVESYQSSQTILADDGNGTKIVINGMPYLDRTHVILVLYYPEATDLICKQIDQLKNPSEWDYLLYLETTKAGQLINQLIPCNGVHLLNFKIELLKASLSSRSIILYMPSEDLMPTVELLHHIGLRSQLHTLVLEGPQVGIDMTIKLFGINPLFQAQVHEPFIKKLDNIGTLFIQNVHFLSLEAQDYLAEYMRHGFFKMYKSDQKILSNTRIICSSNQPFDQLLHNGSMSHVLAEELQKMTLMMPSLSILDDDEIEELVYGYVQQALADKTFAKILEFDKRDCRRIIDSRPTSLQELKKRVQNVLVQKSRSNNIDIEKTFDPAYQITDPDLVEIARLGKHALKDEKAMMILWNKFKNQNKIATFLGVNRSSVNRRCKDYKLQ